MSRWNDLDLTDGNLRAFSPHADMDGSGAEPPADDDNDDGLLPKGDPAFSAYLAEQRVEDTAMAGSEDTGETSDYNDSVSPSASDDAVSVEHLLTGDTNGKRTVLVPTVGPLPIGSLLSPTALSESSPSMSFSSSSSTASLATAAAPCDATTVVSHNEYSNDSETSPRTPSTVTPLLTSTPPSTTTTTTNSKKQSKPSSRKAPTRRQKNKQEQQHQPLKKRRKASFSVKRSSEPLDKRERNRLSAFKYREGRKKHITELEDKVQALEGALSTQQHTISTLQAQNQQLQEKVSFFQSLVATGSEAMKQAAAKFKASPAGQRGGVVMLALLSCFLLCAPLSGLTTVNSTAYSLSSSPAATVSASSSSSPAGAFDPSVSGFRSRALLAVDDTAAASSHDTADGPALTTAALYDSNTDEAAVAPSEHDESGAPTPVQTVFSDHPQVNVTDHHHQSAVERTVPVVSIPIAASA